MTAPTSHNFNVYFSPDGREVRWAFDGANDGATCKVHVNDEIVFSFQPETGFTGTLDQCVLITGNEQQSESGSPFGTGKMVSLKNNDKLHVGGQKGTWGFSISFSVTHTDGTTGFYFVPDPELQVGSIRP